MNITENVSMLLRQLDLEYKRGGHYFHLSCPFASDPKSAHKNGDRNPSFVIYEKRDLAVCFGCGLKFKLHEFFEAYCKFKDKTINLEYIDCYVDWDFEEDEDEDVDNYILDESILRIFEKYPKRISYLQKRNIDVGNIPFDVLYDSGFNNILCPIRLLDGSLVGATGRNIVEKRHHHYFSLKTTRCLLGLERHDAKKAIIVEGLTDFLNLYSKITELNLDYNIYATLTCSMSDWQAKNLVDLGKPLYMCWDRGDIADKKRPKALDKLKDAYVLYDVDWGFKNTDGSLKDPGDFNKDEVLELFGDH